MSNTRQTGGAAEMAIRRELFRRGLRYRVNYKVLKSPRRVADIVFTRKKIAVFVDGCFWHGCPEHVTWPKRNADFWREKIETNRLRDEDTNTRLRKAGWVVLRFWEHEPPTQVADAIFGAITAADSKQRERLSRSRKKY